MTIAAEQITAEVKGGSEGKRIEHLKRTIRTLTEQRDQHAKTIEELREKLEDEDLGFCDCDCGTFQGCELRERAFEDSVREMAEIHTLMASNPRAARERLAGILDDIDSAWRTFA